MALVTFAGVATAGEPELTVVDAVDLDRYLGEWYEIASYPAWFQRNCTAVTADYSLRDDGVYEQILARLPDKDYDPAGLQRTVQADRQVESEEVDQ